RTDHRLARSPHADGRLVGSGFLLESHPAELAVIRVAGGGRGRGLSRLFAIRQFSRNRRLRDERSALVSVSVHAVPRAVCLYRSVSISRVPHGRLGLPDVEDDLRPWCYFWPARAGGANGSGLAVPSAIPAGNLRVLRLPRADGSDL